MKTFLYVLITNFVFSETNEKVVKANVYVALVLLFWLKDAPALKGTSDRQGTHKTLYLAKVQGGESVSDDGDSVHSRRSGVSIDIG